LDYLFIMSEKELKKTILRILSEETSEDFPLKLKRRYSNLVDEYEHTLSFHRMCEYEDISGFISNLLSEIQFLSTKNIHEISKLIFSYYTQNQSKTKKMLKQAFMETWNQRCKKSN